MSGVGGIIYEQRARPAIPNRRSRVPAILDHIIIAILIVGIPLTGVAQRRKLVQTLTDGAPDPKRTTYRVVLVKQWTAAAMLAGYWWLMNRPFDALGL
jgi:hypothetical protein